MVSLAALAKGDSGTGADLSVGMSINRLKVSGKLFALAAAAIERESVLTGKFATISDVLKAQTARLLERNFERTELEGLLDLDLHGEVPVTLIIRDTWKPAYEEARRTLGRALGRDITARQMLAITVQLPIPSDPGDRA